MAEGRYSDGSLGKARSTDEHSLNTLSESFGRRHTPSHQVKSLAAHAPANHLAAALLSWKDHSSGAFPANLNFSPSAPVCVRSLAINLDVFDVFP